MDAYYRLVSRVGLLTPAHGKWILRLLGFASLAFVALVVIPGFVGEYRAMHGIAGVMQVDHCDASRGRYSTAWTCRGSFAGDDGSTIANVTVNVRQEAAPASPYAVKVASAAATKAYPPGGQGYVDDAILAGVAGGCGVLLLYWSYGGRRWRGGAAAGAWPPSRRARRVPIR